MKQPSFPFAGFILQFLAIRPGGIRHTFGLLGAMIVVLCACAWVLGGLSLVISAAVAVALMILVSPMISADFLMRLLRAQPISPGSYPAIHEMVGLLSERAGLGYVPKLFLMPGKGVNAITTGAADRTVIAISNDALNNLTPRQMRAVLAHEISHAWHGDTRILMFTDVLYRATWTLAFLGFMLFLFGHLNPPVWLILVFGAVPSISFLLQRAVIRDREFAADHGAAELLGGPDDMIDALQHIDQINKKRFGLVTYHSTQPPSILDTHPSIPVRIEALRAMAPETWQDYFNRPQKRGLF